MSSSFLCCSLLSVSLLACSASRQDTTQIDKPSGKTDISTDFLCDIVGLDAGCDICADQGWLGDGACDDFCQTPDPDCASFNPLSAQCDFAPLEGAETSRELKALATLSTTSITPESVSSVSSLRSQQLLTAARFASEDPTLDQAGAFDSSDDGDFSVLIGTVKSTPVVWFRWFAGDTEVGVVFAGETLEILAKVDDGDISTCTTPDGPATGAAVTTTSCDIPLFLDFSTSRDLSPLSTSSTELRSPRHFSSLQKQQLFQAAVLTDTTATTPSNVQEVLSIVDGGVITFVELAKGSDRYTWLQFFVGDTEVGAVFKAETADLVAEINDQDLSSCQ